MVYQRVYACCEGTDHSCCIWPAFSRVCTLSHIPPLTVCQALVDAHVMFKDMNADLYLRSAGIASDWPYGRGCWQSADKQCIIWFGEEDHLRIMCMKKGSRLNEVFTRLKKMLDLVETLDGIDFARSSKYGYITSCPTNLGTGMRASVHIKVPNLTADGQADPHGNSPTCKAICNPLGLSVRGTGGEHTPIGKDGTIDLSPRARLFIKEKEIIAALYRGITNLMAAEKKAAAAANPDDDTVVNEFLAEEERREESFANEVKKIAKVRTNSCKC